MSVVEAFAIIQYNLLVVRSGYTGNVVVKEVIKLFICRGCMLSVDADGDADAAVETRIRIGWNKFRQLVPLLTNKDISLTVRGRLLCAKQYVAWK